MFTRVYRSRYINGYCDRPECYVPGLGRFKTYRSAQLAISAHIKREGAK